MSKIKRFLKMHYKKFVTVITVAVLCFVVFVSQAFAVQYNYRLLEDYRSSVIDYYWNLHDENNNNLKLDYVIPSRDPTNNRFTASVDLSSGGIDMYCHRFDLTIRFNSSFTFEQGDNVTYQFLISSNCHLYTTDDINGYVPATYWLQFFRVWYEDDTTYVAYPEHQYCTSGQLNDTYYVIEQGTLQSSKPRIVSMQFSFNLSQGVNVGNPLNDLVYWNIWFNNSIQCNIDRNTSQNPIYTPPNNDSINNHNKIEQGIQEDISGGLEDTNIIFDNFNNMSDESRLTRGMLFITQLMSRVFAFEAYDILGEFALAIGLVGFLLGLATLLKGGKQKDDKPEKPQKPHTKENSDSYNDYSRRRR